MTTATFLGHDDPRRAETAAAQRPGGAPDRRNALAAGEARTGPRTLNLGCIIEVRFAPALGGRRFRL
jgi:hypothetical protein